MGEHAELSAREWGITREEQDEIALRSHLRAAAATADGRLRAEIHPLGGIDRDTIVRADTSLERLAKLPPVFDRSPRGTITAGNASPLTDGAAAVLLMSEAAARRAGHEPLASAPSTPSGSTPRGAPSPSAIPSPPPAPAS
jgi:acetyl-CoA acetyltransferase